MIDKKTRRKVSISDKIQIDNCWKDSSIPNGYEINRTYDGWAIVLLTNGNLELNNFKHTMSENDIFIFPPNSIQNVVYSNNASSYWINFRGDNLQKVFDNLNIPSEMVCSIKNPEFGQILDYIAKEFIMKNLHYKEIAVANFKSFLYMLSRELTVKIPVNQNAIKEVILAMYSNPHISNEECAKLCLMSKDHFIRIFKMACGITPLQFKKNIIISRAKNLLTKTNLSITSIAESSGFIEYPLYFNRFFKQATGYYPSKYRELFGEQSNKNTTEKD